MGIRWQDKVSNQQVLDPAKMSSIEVMLLKAQLRWTGHVDRMKDNRIPKQLMYSELKHGSRKQGRPKLRYKDTLKSNLRWCDIKPCELETAAMSDSAWRSNVSRATTAVEDDHKTR